MVGQQSANTAAAVAAFLGVLALGAAAAWPGPPSGEPEASQESPQSLAVKEPAVTAPEPEPQLEQEPQPQPQPQAPAVERTEEAPSPPEPAEPSPPEPPAQPEPPVNQPPGEAPPADEPPADEPAPQRPDADVPPAARPPAGQTRWKSLQPLATNERAGRAGPAQVEPLPAPQETIPQDLGEDEQESEEEFDIEVPEERDERRERQLRRERQERQEREEREERQRRQQPSPQPSATEPTVPGFQPVRVISRRERALPRSGSEAPPLTVAGLFMLTVGMAFRIHGRGRPLP